MSGDKRIPSLIALVESGSFTENDSIEIPGVEIFFANLATLPDKPIRDDFEPWAPLVKEYNIYGEWENIVYKPFGYCPVKWGQGEIYNRHCPIINNKRAPTGNVATAVAQLMATYKHPSGYRETIFNWDEMVECKKSVGV